MKDCVICKRPIKDHNDEQIDRCYVQYEGGIE